MLDYSARLLVELSMQNVDPTHRSASLIFPKYLWVIARLECRKRIFETISIGVPDRLAYVPECLRKSCGLKRIPTRSPAFLTTIMAAA
jgi:hypothetical protein